MKKPVTGKRSPIITNEMNELLAELDALINYYETAGRKPPMIRLNGKQWKCLQKDRKRGTWKQDRSSGYFHHDDGSSEYRKFRLVPENTRPDWKPGEQLEVFAA